MGLSDTLIRASINFVLQPKKKKSADKFAFYSFFFFFYKGMIWKTCVYALVNLNLRQVNISFFGKPALANRIAAHLSSSIITR